ncbi:MAG: hypothetical protein K9G42_05825 [Pedobacter sp.]|nr:hypothetical protein [Pedobacter sp.]
MSELEKIALILKKEVGQFHPDLFAARTVSILHELTAPWNANVISGLVSPMRQLLYLLNLNLTTPTAEPYKERFYEDSDWPKVVNILQQMEMIHRKEYGEQKPFTEEQFSQLNPDEVLRRRTVGIGTYNAFFHVGPLQFEEQAIEKITDIFKNFSKDLKGKLGWDALDLIRIYDTLDRLRQTKEDEAYMKPTAPFPSQAEFTSNVREAMKNGMSFQEAMIAGAPNHNGILTHRSNPSRVNTFTREDLTELPETLINLLLEHFTVDRHSDKAFLFFSQPNQLWKKPIYRMQNGSFLLIDHRMLLTAMAGFIKTECSKILKDGGRITKTRDKFLERKVENLFAKYYSGTPDTEIIPSYYVNGSERDLLVLSGKTVIIVESKAGNIREPAFDPDKAYDRIWADFKDTIDYGYEQGYSVKEKFLQGKAFTITDNQRRELRTIDPKDYKHIYVIIVTLNKFGQAQNDLWLMLDLFEEDDQYPWSVCVDDLEIFLLSLKKLNRKPEDFHHFLRKRAELHKQLIVNDEGRVMGYFLKHKKFTMNSGYYTFSKQDDIIFDKLYSTGLGFENERWLNLKQDPKIRKIY